MMRWDFGAVYKEIRESKGLSQKEVVGDRISRQSLISFDKGDSTPRYETMDYLLRQIDMSFAEFEYICHYYHPSERQEIFNAFYRLVYSHTADEVDKLLEKCQDYLKTQYDLPVQHVTDLLHIYSHVRKNGIHNLSDEIEKLTKTIWQRLEKQDIWYENDLRMLNAILYSIPLESVHLFVERMLATFEKYKNYAPIRTWQMTILSNLATLYLYNDQIENCQGIVEKVMEIAKSEKRYDKLAFNQVRLGICRKDKNLIDKGLTLLTLMDEGELLATAKEEVKQFYEGT